MTAACWPPGVGPEEQVIFLSHGRTADRAFGTSVVDLQLPVLGVASQRLPPLGLENVIKSLGECRASLDLRAYPHHPGVRSDWFLAGSAQVISAAWRVQCSASRGTPLTNVASRCPAHPAPSLRSSRASVGSVQRVRRPRSSRQTSSDAASPTAV